MQQTSIQYRDLLFPINSSEVSKILSHASHSIGDFSEIYYQHSIRTIIDLDEDIIKSARTEVITGVGVRVIYRDQLGYAYTEEITPESITKSIQAAAEITRNGRGGETIHANKQQSLKAVELDSYPSFADTSIKTSLLQEANACARDEDSQIIQVLCTYFDEFKIIEIINSDGYWRRDNQSFTNIMVRCIANDNGLRDYGMSIIGGRYPLEYFTVSKVCRTAKKAARQAVLKLSAVQSPSGMMPVVIGKGWGGVLVHESVGHGLEGDFNRKNISIYSGRIGEKVASDLVTIVDDPRIRNGRGSYRYDDEGACSQRNVLIERGRLKGYLYDRFNAHLSQIKNSTGNGRRQSYRNIPIPRMSNTFIDRGDSDPEEIIASVKKGIFAKELGGGQVDISSGNFVFEINEGYLIENGRITAPIRGANLIGNGPRVMTLVTMVGKDLKIEKGLGTCGKDGQYIFVGVGQPTIKVKEMTIGGTI